jgi:hypothetical protein
MGRPGWPELDLLIASTARKRMLLMQRLSTEVVVATTMAERGRGEKWLGNGGFPAELGETREGPLLR